MNFGHFSIVGCCSVLQVRSSGIINFIRCYLVFKNIKLKTDNNVSQTFVQFLITFTGQSEMKGVLTGYIFRQ